MKKLTYLFFGLACASGFTACYDNAEIVITEVDSPVMVYVSPSDGSTVQAGDVTVKVAYDKNVFFASEDYYLIEVTDDGSVESASVIGSSDTLTIVASFPSRAATYTMTIPDGLVTGPNSIPAASVSFTFSTTALDSIPVMNLTDRAQKVYDYLYENFETNTLSAAMAKDGLSDAEFAAGIQGSWNTVNADKVYTWTGKYPAMNCFDYLHLANSGEDWIDYDDITPVQDWWNSGGLVLAMWHWLVPQTEDDALNYNVDNYSYSYDEDGFDIDNAFTEGNWEYDVVEEGLEKIADKLELLRDADIPVIWRPLHEASGGWFWWGKDADSFKLLWQRMFDYFTERGLNNLIWVFTSESDDTDWYPGDDYVDIVGRDLYGNDADDCADEYSTLVGNYGNKMITLSECGYSDGSLVGNISDQWESGARWLWFMPWYDSDDTEEGEYHNTEDWWEDAMDQDYVISRDDLPDSLFE